LWASGGDDIIYPYKENLVIKSNYTFSLNTDKEKYNDFYLSILNIDKLKVMNLDSSNQFFKNAGISKMFIVDYYKDSIGLLYHTYIYHNRPSNICDTLYRLDLESMKYLWKIPICIMNKQLIVDMSYILLGYYYSMKKNVFIEIYDIKTGRIHKSYNFPMDAENGFQFLNINLLKNILIVQYFNKKTLQINYSIININSGKKYSLNTANIKHRNLEVISLFNKEGKNYWYIPQLGVYE
jgi:hypothetical protein